MFTIDIVVLSRNSQCFGCQVGDLDITSHSSLVDQIPRCLPHTVSCFLAALISGLVVTIEPTVTGGVTTINIALNSGSDMTMFVILGDENAQEVHVAHASEVRLLTPQRHWQLLRIEEDI